MQPHPPAIQIAQPKRFTARAVLVINAYGILLLLPLCCSILLVSLFKFSLLTLLIPLLVVAASVCLLPFGLGNSCVTRLVKSLPAPPPGSPDPFVVQLTTSPRIRSGLRAILDDADDVGYLHLASAALSFQGDSVNLSVPYDHILQIQPRNIGWRGLFLYGRRIKLRVSGLPNLDALEFTERSSCHLFASKSITRRLHEQLSAKLPPTAP